MRRTTKWALALLGLGFAIGFGLWAQSLFVKSELMHFSVSFPSDGRAETMSCCDLGGPWARDRDPDWDDYSAGGVLAYGEEGAIVIDVGQQGLLKRALQPNYLSISNILSPLHIAFFSLPTFFLFKKLTRSLNLRNLISNSIKFIFSVRVAPLSLYHH